MTNGSSSDVDELRRKLSKVTKERDYLKKQLQNIAEAAEGAVNTMK